MEIKQNGLEVRINPAEQPDEWLLNAAQEITNAMRARNLELTTAAGTVSLSGKLQEAANQAVESTAMSTKESLAQQLPWALEGYRAVANALNRKRRPRERVVMLTNNVLETEFNSWLTDDKIKYVESAQEADPELSFTLVATPNVDASREEIVEAAKEFGQTQPYPAHVPYKFYAQYSDKELTGTFPENGSDVMFSLIPDKPDEKLYGTVAEQKASLIKLQMTTPSLKVSSVLEGITLWNTLKAQNGDTLPADESNFDRTFIRHFDLPAKWFGGWSRVPHSFVGGDGGPCLGISFADRGDRARVSVG